jgi:hypothetical protein
MSEKFVRSGVAILSLVFACAAFAADATQPAEPTSPAAKQAKAEYDAAVKKAEDELAAARKAYLEKLDAALKQVMQAGDLEEANRIDALRRSVRNPPVANANAAGGPAKAAAQGQKPGWIVGRITDARGQPVTGVQFEVVAFGTTIQGGQRAEFQLEVDADGRFEQEVPDGLYAMRAYVTKEFEGTRYRLQLHPNDEKHEQTKLSSKPGIVKDFTWRLTGLRPGFDPKQAFSYYGPEVRLYDARYLGDDNEHMAHALGDEAKVVITMTPKGTLVDGSKGEPVVINTTLGAIRTTISDKKFDVPLAAYRVEAKVITKDGKELPLKVKTEFSAKGEPAVDATFKQNGIYDSITPITIYMER